MRRRIGELYYQGAFQEAADILSRGLTAFPDHLVANVFNLALCQVQLSDQEGAINTLQVGLEQGVWFGPYEIGIDAWGPITGRSSEKSQAYFAHHITNWI